jgi:hypothetical protein
VLALLRDHRTRPDEWDARERRAVTRLHSWAFRHDEGTWPMPRGPVAARVQVEEDEQGLRFAGALARPDEPKHYCPTCHQSVAVPIETPRLSDGYLADAEEWGTHEQLVEYARWSGHGVLPSSEVLALIRLDRILGNAGAMSARGVGRLRSVVLRALHDWHARQRAITDSLDRGPSVPDAHPVLHEQRTLRPIEEDPHRPHPAASTWPDDAVLLTYRELRRLVSLHLERYVDDPAPARAMLEADVPLRLGEVLA